MLVLRYLFQRFEWLLDLRGAVHFFRLFFPIGVDYFVRWEKEIFHILSRAKIPLKNKLTFEALPFSGNGS